MVMPMTCSNESMFPPSPFSYKEFSDACTKQYGVKPREHWITTEFGGKVSFFSFPSHGAFHIPVEEKKGFLKT